ncbi:MAG: IclR-family transcriptional regulator [Microbacteriaceae bacterium]|jgi:DNA-binding IclR family transcriptional regulator|nr:IclR-family transcriptional regulator [Microbacteriaceae bacterium]HEV7957581.1 IclR family transcriptional regulator [Marisediminicola sp.]
MQPIVRALKILRTLGMSQAGLTLSELATHIGLPVSTTYRIAQVLQDEGFLIRTPAGKRYMIGPSARTLVSETSGAYVRQAGHSYASELNRMTQETVFLSELVGNQAVCIAVYEGMRPLRFLVRPGGTLPLHAAAGARAILAWLPDLDRTHVLDGIEYTRWTSKTITTPSELYRKLDETREQGYDICDDELEERAWAVGAPIFDLTNRVRASITVVAPLESMSDQVRRASVIDLTEKAARSISTELGFFETAKSPDS